MNYQHLTDENKKSTLQAKLIAAEQEHYRITLDLKIARVHLKHDLKGAEGKVMDLERKLKEAELAITALSDGE